MRMKARELTEGEWVIMKAVWQHEPCTAPDIQEALEKSKGWHYSTVRTIMDRMARKGLLSTERLRNLTIYRAVITRSQARGREVSRTLKRAFDGALTPMMQFLISSKDLSTEELDKLEQLIGEKRRKRGARRKKSVTRPS